MKSLVSHERAHAARGSNFLLLRQKKVTKEKATPTFALIRDLKRKRRAVRNSLRSNNGPLNRRFHSKSRGRMNGDPFEPKFDRCAIGVRDPEYASLLRGYGATWKLKSEHGSIDGMFVIEDELHAEWQGEFTALSEALAELKARADIAWDMAPNVAPCTNWKSCGRAYEIIEYDSSTKPWKEVRRFAALNVSASGTVWNDELPTGLQ